MTSAPLGLAYLDRDLRFVQVNRTFAVMTGLRPDAPLKGSLSDALPRHAPTLEPLLRQVMLTGTPRSNVEVQGDPELAGVESRPFHASLFPVCEGGQVTGAGIILQEAAVPSGTDRACEPNGARLRAMLEHSPEVVAMHTPDGRLLAAKPSARRILGFPVEEFAGPRALQRIHPDDFEKVHGSLTELRNSPGREVALQYRTKHMDGAWRWVEVRGVNAVEDPEVGGILTYYRDITERKQLEERLIHQAFHDPLTRLPNRMHFINSLEEALRREPGALGCIAVMFIDLDGFKVINDSLGHSVGDKLLVEVSRRILKSLRSEDTLARMGGDEFTIFIEQVHKSDEAVEVAKRILGELKQPFYLSEREIFISASIGIALDRPENARTDDLLRKADIALYEAKKKGKSCYEIFDLSMYERALRRLEQESELRRAMDKGELRVYYQPVVDLQTGRVEELEALVRWEHPQRGLLLPSEFIPLAEETGQIVEIDYWVLRTAAGTVRRLRERYEPLSALSLNVNFSAMQFRQDHLAARILQILTEAGLPPNSLKIEITENIMQKERDSILSRLRELKKLGIRLSVDDIGTGFSGIKQLKRLPLDILKIDRAITRDLHSGGERGALEKDMASKIFSFGKALGMGVTGEGIENLDQLHHLKKMGCKLGQGYLFARPQPIEELQALFDRLPYGEAVPIGTDGSLLASWEN